MTAAAALDSTTFGLQGVVDDTAGLYVQDNAPADEDRYRARFFFDPNDFDPGESAGARRTRIFIAFSEAPNRRLLAIVLRRQGGSYSVMGRVRQDANSQADTGFFPITNAAHAVELDWRRASGAEALDGAFQMWIDGVSVSILSAMDNSRDAVDFLSVKSGAAGTLYWDEFESRRETYIGP